MNVSAFLAACHTTEMQDLVAQLGGWDAVLESWRTGSADDALFADVWEMMLFLYAESALLADRMSVHEDVVVHFAGMLNTLAVSDRLGEAQDLLGSFCSDIAEAYDVFAQRDAADTDASALAGLWRAWADGFTARAPRVFVAPLV